MKRSPKIKKVFPGFGRISIPKMAQETSLRGAKVAQGWPKYLQGGSCPPALLLPAPMQIWVKFGQISVN